MACIQRRTIPGSGSTRKWANRAFESGFRHGMTKERLKEIRRLEHENGKLKELVAEKELLIKMLEEKHVKKFGPWVRAKR